MDCPAVNLSDRERTSNLKPPRYFARGFSFGVGNSLGHENVTSTLTSYIRGNKETRRSASGTLEDAILPKDGKLGIA